MTYEHQIPRVWTTALAECPPLPSTKATIHLRVASGAEVSRSELGQESATQLPVVFERHMGITPAAIVGWFHMTRSVPLPSPTYSPCRDLAILSARCSPHEDPTARSSSATVGILT